MQYLYACHFSNGHIKVGRSSDPKSRIASHEERVSCLGVELVEHAFLGCSGYVIPSETMLIDRCAAVASKRHKSEWFVGLDFQEVCGWMTEITTKKFQPLIEKLVLDGNEVASDAELIVNLGGPANVARLLKLTGAHPTQRVINWMTRGVPAQIKVDFPHIFMRSRPKAKPA